MVDDPFRYEGWAESVAASVRNADSAVEFYEYPGTGHLFTDRSLLIEHDEAATVLFWSRVLDFCEMQASR